MKLLAALLALGMGTADGYNETLLYKYFRKYPPSTRRATEGEY